MLVILEKMNRTLHPCFELWYKSLFEYLHSNEELYHHQNANNFIKLSRAQVSPSLFSNPFFQHLVFAKKYLHSVW